MGLTPEQEARARRVFEEHLVISLHDHAFLVPEDLGEFSEYRRQVKHIHAQQGFERVPYVAGIENPAEAMPNVVRWLVQHGYSDDDIARAVGGNAMRVLDKVWWK
jgi:microsomal dipeptidase-like Zn-dependent dipeptidase